MCGFAGFRGSFPMGWLSSAGDLIAHRGPDDCGMWIAPDGSAGLVHRRLSIIDLTAAGHQPMVDPETGVVIAYNGEIYNYRELRAELQARGGIFRSASDTEVLVQGLVRRVSGKLVHLDSPDLEHWLNTQNKYTTALAIEAYNRNELVDKPRLFGTPLQQRMWLKKHFMWLPCRYSTVLVSLLGARRLACRMGGLCLVTPAHGCVSAVGIQVARDSVNGSTADETASRTRGIRSSGTAL